MLRFAYIGRGAWIGTTLINTGQLRRTLHILRTFGLGFGHFSGKIAGNKWIAGIAWTALAMRLMSKSGANCICGAGFILAYKTTHTI